MRNTRFIVGIIAFLGTFAVSVGLVWMLFGFPVKPNTFYSQHNCSQRHTGAIYSHLRRDINNGRERDIRSFQANTRENDGKLGYSVKIHAASVAQYIDESGSMDVSHLPQDFQISWKKHIDAWRDYSEFLNAKKISSEENLDDEEFEMSENPYNSEIKRTWYEVLRIGRSYGAYVE